MSRGHGYDSIYASFQPTGTPIFGYDPSAKWLIPLSLDIAAGKTSNLREFTAKERDQESGLDYFGARYFGSALGRFTSPDWSGKPQPVPYADLTNPQSLNLYGYVLNNPLSRVDPNGHINCTGANAQKIGRQYLANWNKEHGIDPSAKRSDAPGVPVKLPNGKTVYDPYTKGPLMSPTSDLSGVAAAGKSLKADVTQTLSGWDETGGTALSLLYFGLKKDLRQNGDFDYQRATFVAGDLQQLRQFWDVSNFNVGLLAQQAGLSLDEVLTIAGTYARLNSSNYHPDQPYGLDKQTKDLTVLGFQTGVSGAYGQ